MQRIQLSLIAILFMASSSMLAQSEFAKLPAKVKSRMAVEEELASEQDEAFQSMMMKGMQHFEKREYDEALEAFQQAEDKRPLNVYPPVMIEDVRLSIRLLAEEQAERAKQKESIEEPSSEKPNERELTADERVALMYEAEMRKVRGEMPPPPPEPEPEQEMDEPLRDKEGLIIEEQKEEVLDKGTEEESVWKDQESDLEINKANTEVEETIQETTVSEKEPEPAVESPQEVEPVKVVIDSKKELEDGMTERTFKEGNKQITECVITKGGESHTYRKVVHAWGGKFYFKDGESVTQRVWEEEVRR